MSSILLQRFTTYLKEECLVPADATLLLAVSGGIDSVVLGALCREASLYFHVAHVNFKLRGEESERDAAFVRELAGSWKVPFHFTQFDTAHFAETKKCSVQEAARQLRYEWFEKVVEAQLAKHGASGPSIICTAHHLDDNIETMVMHFFRGTGIQGLRGMLPRLGRVARPLLFVSKDELTEYATQNKLSWVEDSSNAESKYTRNAIRNKLLPMAASIYPEAIGNLARNIYRFRDVEILYQQAIAHHRKKLVKINGNEVHVPVALLERSVPFHTILYEIIRDYNFTSAQVDEVKMLMNADSGKYVKSATHRIFRNRKWLIIAPLQTDSAGNILVEEGGGQIDFPNGQLHITRAEGKAISRQNNIATVDLANIQFPLLLRKWKQGDYFYPLGMKKKKKLSRFFIDNKLSATQKENTWVLEMNKKIIWVIGQRIDDRFRITDQTSATLKLEFLPQRELK